MKILTLFALGLSALVSVANSAPTKESTQVNQLRNTEDMLEKMTQIVNNEQKRSDDLGSLLEGLGSLNLKALIDEVVSDNSSHSKISNLLTDELSNKNVNISGIYNSVKGSGILSDILDFLLNDVDFSSIIQDILSLFGDSTQSSMNSTPTQTSIIISEASSAALNPSESSLTLDRRTDVEMDTIAVFMNKHALTEDFIDYVFENRDLAAEKEYLISEFLKNSNLTEVLQDLKNSGKISSLLQSIQVPIQVFPPLDSSEASDLKMLLKRSVSKAESVSLNLNELTPTTNSYITAQAISTVDLNQVSISDYPDYAGLTNVQTSESVPTGDAIGSSISLILNSPSETEDLSSTTTGSSSINDLFDELLGSSSDSNSTSTSQDSTSDIIKKLESLFDGANSTSSSSDSTGSLTSELLDIVESALDSLVNEFLNNPSSLSNLISSVFQIAEKVFDLFLNNASGSTSEESGKLITNVLHLSKSAISQAMGNSDLQTRDTDGNSLLDIIFNFIESEISKIFSGDGTGSGLFSTIFKIAGSALNAIIKAFFPSLSSNSTTSSSGGLLDEIFHAFTSILKSSNFTFTHIFETGISALESNSGSGKSFLQVILEDVLDLFENGIGSFLSDLVNLFVRLLFGNSSSSSGNSSSSLFSSSNCCCSGTNKRRELKRELRRSIKSTLKTSLIKRDNLKRRDTSYGLLFPSAL